MSDTAPPDETLRRRIEVIQSSLRCFGLSLAGLIPVLGLPCAVIAMAQVPRVRRKAGTDWNPAAGYLKAAGWISPLSFLSTALFLALVVSVTVSMQSSANCSSGHG